MINFEEKLQKAIELYGIVGVHPAANIPPFMSEREYNELVEDVRENGFLHPVRITKDELLIDGRNRLCASIDVGKDVRIEEYTPINPIKYVLSENKRRNLTYEQRLAMALKAESLYADDAKIRQEATLPEKGQKGFQSNAVSDLTPHEDSTDATKTRTKAAEQAGVSTGALGTYKKLKNNAPEIADKVDSGELSLNAANNEYKEIQKVKTTKKFNATNENIEWAKWSWNPVTGCLHDCPYCLHPDTLITMTDCTTKKLSEIKIGDSIIGTQKKNKNRIYTESIVTHKWNTTNKETYKITMENGNEVICSKDHRFLTKRGIWKYVIGAQQGKERRPHLTVNDEFMGFGYVEETLHQDIDYKQGYVCGMIHGDGMLQMYDYSGNRRARDVQYQFRLAMNDKEAIDRTRNFLLDLEIPTKEFIFLNKMFAIRNSSKKYFDRLSEIANEFKDSYSFARGYLAAAYDSDGSLCGNTTIRIFKANTEHINRIQKYLKTIDIPYKMDTPKITVNKTVNVLRITGGFKNFIKFFSVCDPVISRKKEGIFKSVKHKENLKIKSIEYIGVMDLIDITTTTHDFIANGIVSHNCYARDIAMRFDGDFDPKFHEDRLSAPKDTVIPKNREEESGIRNVFVCSMADLFGDWVDKEWIDKVISKCNEYNEWNYLFLTKNPKRYLEFDFPENCWLGASATDQKQFERAAKTFNKITNNNIKFLSCEPLNERIDAYELTVDWLIIGGRSKSSGMPAFQPEWEWVEHLLFQARKQNVQVYFKPNLATRPMEYPK